jgi:exodeoxyribonuclease VII small subunit
MAAKKEVKFEENIKELENIINTLEGGEVSLDEMLNLFEEGIKRTKECTKQLKEAEQKVTVLVKGLNGELEEQPFDAE